MGIKRYELSEARWARIAFASWQGTGFRSDGIGFDDGPAPKGQRYCINSLALDFAPDGGGKP